MRVLPVVVALTFDPTEQALLSTGLIYGTLIGIVGYLLYKIIHVVEETCPKAKAGVTASIDFYYDSRSQIERRRGELRQLQRALQSESPRILPEDARPSPASGSAAEYQPASRSG